MDEFFDKSIKPVGTNIQPQARIVINNVLTFLTELKEDPEKLKTINFNQARDLAAKICGVSLKTVANIRRECTTDGPISPRENICQPRPVRDMDDFDKNVVKKIVSSFYSKGEYPSVKKILEKAKESIEGLKCSHNSMRNILIDLGYKSKTAPDGTTQIMERDDIIATTLQFQSKMKKVKMSDKPKRPMSAYMLWLNSAREQIKADNPGLKVTEIAKKGGEIWRAMKDKSEWEEKAAQAKEQYTKDLESYNANGGGGEGGGGKKAQKRGKKGKKASPAKAKKKKEESDDEDGGDDDEEESE